MKHVDPRTVEPVVVAPTPRVLPEKLSRIPSVAVRQAIEDLRSVEVDPAYRIHMGKWHAPNSAGKCCVCAAGAIMARRLRVSPLVFVEIGEFAPRSLTSAVSKEHHGMLLAVNEFRRGMIPDGVTYLQKFGYGLKVRKRLSPIRVPEYSENREGFYIGMERVATMLEKAGV